MTLQTSTEILKVCLNKCFAGIFDMVTEVDALSKLYFTEVSPDATFAALASGDAATFATQLTKQEIINGLTIAEQIDKFFQNQALAQADYKANMIGITHGNNQYTSPGISPAIEDFGTRIYTLCTTLLEVYNCCVDVLDIYFDTEINLAVGALTGADVPWYHMSVSDLTSGISLVENLKKLINNEVAIQGDYGSTVSVYRKLV